MFTLHNVVLRHDIASYSSSTVSEQFPHLIFDGFSSKLGNRVMSVLKYLFPVPKEDSKRVMTFANEDDFISFRCVPPSLPAFPRNAHLPLTRPVRLPWLFLPFHFPPARHHVFVKNSHREVQLAEVGPRFQMRRTWSPASHYCDPLKAVHSHAAYEIRQGTIEQTEADIEWVLRPYQRTAKKRTQL